MVAFLQNRFDTRVTHAVVKRRDSIQHEQHRTVDTETHHLVRVAVERAHCHERSQPRHRQHGADEMGNAVETLTDMHGSFLLRGFIRVYTHMIPVLQKRRARPRYSQAAPQVHLTLLSRAAPSADRTLAAATQPYRGCPRDIGVPAATGATSVWEGACGTGGVL